MFPSCPSSGFYGQEISNVFPPVASAAKFLLPPLSRRRREVKNAEVLPFPFFRLLSPPDGKKEEESDRHSDSPFFSPTSGNGFENFPPLFFVVDKTK